MTTKSEHRANGVARYYIAQLTPDLFRREPTNIGVIVVKDKDIVAKFVGEKALGVIDKRSLKSYGAPDVYVQWIEYWRRVIKRAEFHDTDLLSANGGNFNIIKGGEVSDIGADSGQQVIDYLFPLLVSDGGLVEALGRRDEAIGVVDTTLKKKVAEAFSNANILDLGSDSMWTPPHPVRKEVPIKGVTAIHNPAYSQINGTPTIMELVDFRTKLKVHAKDHAGFAAFVFRDIKDAMPSTKAVAIIELPSSEMNNETVVYSLSMLNKTADQIVNWSMRPERDTFVSMCVEKSR